jgi:hypothetical protein
MIRFGGVYQASVMDGEICAVKSGQLALGTRSCRNGRSGPSSATYH